MLGCYVMLGIQNVLGASTFECDHDYTESHSRSQRSLMKQMLTLASEDGVKLTTTW